MSALAASGDNRQTLETEQAGKRMASEARRSLNTPRKVLFSLVCREDSVIVLISYR